MMRGAGGALAVGVAALLVCCSAHQEQDVSGSDHNSAERYYSNGHKTRALDTVGNGNLVRQIREVRHSGYVPYQFSRRFDFASPYGGKRKQWPLAPIEYGDYYGDTKRNFDEIDRSYLNTFGKRNFDEIDRSSMPFPYASKRLLYGTNYLDFDTPVPYGGRRKQWPVAPIEYSGYYGDTKRNFDEIDRSDLNTFGKRNFDEIDRSSMPFPYATKRQLHVQTEKRTSNENEKKRPEYPMDEIDLSLLPIGSKRSLD